MWVIEDPAAVYVGECLYIGKTLSDIYGLLSGCLAQISVRIKVIMIIGWQDKHTG